MFQRKCWWDSVEIDVPSSLDTESDETINVKVWARRVWTLELSLVSVFFFFFGHTSPDKSKAALLTS